MKLFEHLYDNYLITPANSIMHDPYRTHFLDTNLINDVLSLKRKCDVQDEFVDVYTKWIHSSKYNKLHGLDSLPNRYISLGVTQGIEDFLFYALKQNLRLRVFRGEYAYSREIANIDWSNECINEGIPLAKGDCVVISTPFSATGNTHSDWDSLLDTCDELDIPVFVDCAFYGTCYGVEVDFNRKCIDTVAFSPTKGLNTGYFRTGMIFTKRSGSDCYLSTLMHHHHGIHLSTCMAMDLMKHYTPDTIVDEYKDLQEQACKHYDLTPTNTVHLATTMDSDWDHFTRDGLINRVCLRNAIYDMKRGTHK